MNKNNLEDRVRELEMQNQVHSALLSAVLAELSISSGEMRVTLEDILWQANEDKEVHIPAEAGEAMPEVNRIIRDLFEAVNKQLSVPLKSRKLL